LASLDRSIDEISMEELAGLAAPFLDLGMDEGTILAMVARALGLSKLRQGSRDRLAKALQRSPVTNQVVSSDGEG
jgi:hypothetical protein